MGCQGAHGVRGLEGYPYRHALRRQPRCLRTRSDRGGARPAGKGRYRDACSREKAQRCRGYPSPRRSGRSGRRPAKTCVDPYRGPTSSTVTHGLPPPGLARGSCVCARPGRSLPRHPLWAGDGRGDRLPLTIASGELPDAVIPTRHGSVALENHRGDPSVTRHRRGTETPATA